MTISPKDATRFEADASDGCSMECIDRSGRFFPAGVDSTGFVAATMETDVDEKEVCKMRLVLEKILLRFPVLVNGW